MRGSTRRYCKEDVQDYLADIGSLPAIVDMDIDIDDAETSRTDYEGIYVPNVASFFFFLRLFAFDVCLFGVCFLLSHSMSVYLMSIFFLHVLCAKLQGT